VAGIEPAS